MDLIMRIRVSSCSKSNEGQQGGGKKEKKAGKKIKRMVGREY